MKAIIVAEPEPGGGSTRLAIDAVRAATPLDTVALTMCHLFYHSWPLNKVYASRTVGNCQWWGAGEAIPDLASGTASMRCAGSRTRHFSITQGKRNRKLAGRIPRLLASRYSTNTTPDSKVEVSASRPMAGHPTAARDPGPSPAFPNSARHGVVEVGNCLTKWHEMC